MAEGTNKEVKKPSFGEMANDAGYTPAEFVKELIESVIAVGMMEIDAQKKEDPNIDQVSWTVDTQDGTQYEIKMTKLEQDNVL